jgi:hypothetical protein
MAHSGDDILMIRPRAASLFAKVRPYSAFLDGYMDGYMDGYNLRRFDQDTENKFVFSQQWRTVPPPFDKILSWKNNILLSARVTTHNPTPGGSYI